MSPQRATTETTDQQIRDWFQKTGWKLEPTALRANLEERGAGVDLVIELLDEGADRRRQAAADTVRERTNGSRPEPPRPAVPAQDQDAEAYLLSAMLAAAGAINHARDILGDTGDDFYLERNRIVYQAILAVHDRGEVVDAVVAAGELARQGRQIDAGGRVYTHVLAALRAVPAAAARYARLVHDAATLRHVQRIAAEAATQTDPEQALELLRDRLGVVEQRHQPDDDTHLVQGGDFMLDTPTTETAVWGDDQNRIGWAAGEGLVIVGPQGVGKTTLAQQLALARAGLLSQVLMLPVQTDPRPVLYIAADRPRQAARSFARMVDEHNRAELNERVKVWRGPLPFLLSEQPTSLARLCDRLGVGTVFLDSIKDFVAKPSDEENANRFNMAIQHCLAAGIEVCTLHHQRKEQQGGGKPKALADVYGNTFLTAGMGSVILLWGDPGDPIVELRHLKQPSDEIGPWEIRHDHDHGRTLRHEAMTLEQLLQRAGEAGLTAQTAAGMLRQTDAPTKNEIEKARKQLVKLVERGYAREIPGIVGDHYNPTRYYPSTPA